MRQCWWLLHIGEPYLTAYGDHLTVALIDVSKPSKIFTPPMFLSQVSFCCFASSYDSFTVANNLNRFRFYFFQVEVDHNGATSTRIPSAADVEEMLKEELFYDGVVECFSRKWRLLVVAHGDQYLHTSIRPEYIVLITVIVATLLIGALVLFIIVRNYNRLRLSDTIISKLEMETQELDVQVTTKEDELNHIAEDLHLLIDTANAPIFGIDIEGRVNEWNKKSAELMGYESHEVMGRDLVQVVKFITPECRSAVKKVFDDARKGLVTSSFEFTLFSKTGIAIELLLNANPRRNKIGQIVGVISFGQDMTAKRKAMETELDLSKASFNPLTLTCETSTLNHRPQTTNHQTIKPSNHQTNRPQTTNHKLSNNKP
jgi:PAS domain S-box-containing protein